jgi:ABC-2 type transport system ATP-binding protein
VELIKLKETSKHYKNHKVLDKVNLTIKESDFLGIIGRSGSGKTTLLNLLAGFIEPTNGKVSYISRVDQKEHCLNRNLHKLKKHIGFTPQHNSFHHKLTVKENLFHFGKMYNLKRKTLMSNIKSLLEFTRLFEFRNHRADELSAGMQKRLDIACAIVHKPKILFLDEPTADLDPILRSEILQMLKAVNQQGVTIVMASHHHDEVEQNCNKVAIVHNSNVHTHGLMDDIKKPYHRDHFTINVHSKKDKEILIKNLHHLPMKKMIDHGNKLSIYPTHIEKTMSYLLNVIQKEQLFLHDLDLRKVSLTEIFENITTDNQKL